MSDHEARRLLWAACENVRDLGGLPTIDGGRIRQAALIRSDSPDRLTSTGIAALREYGVRRIIDLRSAGEAAARPGPFVSDPMYRLLPFIDPRQEALRDPAAEPTLASVYCASITRNASHIVAAIAAIADAPPGGVLVHCASGKDRTGMTVALVLRVAGTADDVIASDYAYTAACLRTRFDAELADAPDDAARQRLRAQQGTPPETILAMLHRLDEEYGDVATYLRTHGLTGAQLTRLRDRLREQFPDR
jgi:protein tyrosine/serine phosphatase